VGRGEQIMAKSDAFPAELNRWRAAQQLIRQHAEGAELEAAQRADRAIAKGSPEGERLWLDVLNKVRALQAETPPDRRVN
jgi:hypothetical protein